MKSLSSVCALGIVIVVTRQYEKDTNYRIKDVLLQCNALHTSWLNLENAITWYTGSVSALVGKLYSPIIFSLAIHRVLQDLQ